MLLLFKKNQYNVMNYYLNQIVEGNRKVVRSYFRLEPVRKLFIVIIRGVVRNTNVYYLFLLKNCFKNTKYKGKKLLRNVR